MSRKFDAQETIDRREHLVSLNVRFQDQIAIGCSRVGYVLVGGHRRMGIPQSASVKMFM